MPMARLEAFSRLSSMGGLPAETGAILFTGLKNQNQMKYQ